MHDGTVMRLKTYKVRMFRTKEGHEMTSSQLGVSSVEKELTLRNRKPQLVDYFTSDRKKSLVAQLEVLPS